MNTKIRKTIRKAVFPVAGFGTRFLPATKAMPKELLPIVDKPLIQYAVEEAYLAGIEVMVFITGRNKRAIEDHFDNSPELENLLKLKGSFDQADMVKNIIPDYVSCVFVRQPEQLGLGHAVSCAEPVVGDEPFAVLLADDFLTLDNENTTKKLCDEYKKTGNTQLCVMEVNGPDISKYGVVEYDKKTGLVKGLVEKPSTTNAPSNNASIGRYILTPDIFPVLGKLPKGANNEIQLADAINNLSKLGRVNSVKLKERRFDCGSVEGFMAASTYEYNRRKAEK